MICWQKVTSSRQMPNLNAVVIEVAAIMAKH